jgi:hypothetical protein
MEDGFETGFNGFDGCGDEESFQRSDVEMMF